MIISQAKQELRTQLGERQAAIISLTPADQLKVFNAGVLVENLPPAWARCGNQAGLDITEDGTG